MIGSPYKRRSRFTSRTCFMLSLELVVLFFAIWRLGLSVLPSSTNEPTTSADGPVSQGLTRRDVLPTPTPDASAPVRLIAFPGASMSAPVIPAGRIQGSWETRHLGDSVGHLVGTSWLDEAGGNIVLAGHVESYTGAPGPFAHLFEAKIGDLVILREGLREEHFRVTQIERVEPDNVSWLAQDGRPRVTLITCTEWDNDSRTYQGRLIVVAEPA
ncbi:MAG: class F sortase, partial [Chloroflexi bacterium]|nr:class F sortase [Chloroflexota bacterium]